MSENDSHTLQGKTIRCILFDCGETLWTHPHKDILQHEENSANQLTTILLHHIVNQQDFPLQDDATLAHDLRTAIYKITDLFKNEHPYYEPDFAHVTKEALVQLGFPQLSDEAGAEVFEALRVRSVKARTLFPDALTTLATLQKRGFILGIVTNRAWGGQPFVEDMRVFGLLDYFDPACMVVSADLHIRKPNPAIFMHALNALHAAPTEAAMVGDALYADVAGADQLDIFTIWKPSPRLITEAKVALPANQPYLNYQHLFPYVQRHYEQQNRPRPMPSAPNLIIEQLSDLLDIFLEAGVQ
ncbi:MAG: HAD family hydrolase [Ktedonobacteraceae bacterium]|nr:HAD family hydrolase [Ktedonobacteraceae bacterium]